MLKATFLHARHFAVDQRPTHNKYTTKYKMRTEYVTKNQKSMSVTWNEIKNIL